MNYVKITLQKSWKISGEKTMKNKEELLPGRKNFMTGKDSLKEMLQRMSNPKYLSYLKRTLIRMSLGLSKLTWMTDIKNNH